MLKECLHHMRNASSPATRIAIVIFLMVATLAVYLQVVNHEFIFFDDPDYIINNTNIHYGINLHSISWAFTTFHASNWHPLTWLSHMLDVQLFGLNPAGHLFTNLVLHVANTILLFLFLSRFTGSLWRSAMVAALFALHPLHVESVAWASERKDVLSAFFWMATIILYCRYVERSGKINYFLTLLSMALGLMAKPMLVTLPLVLLFLDYWPLGRTGTTEAHPPRRPQSLRALLLEKAPFAALSAISCLLTIAAQRSVITNLEATPISARIANAFVSYLLYLYKMLLPWNLSVLYQFNDTIPLWQFLGAAILLAVASRAVVVQRRRRPYLLVGWLWYLCTLVPVIGIVKVGSQGLADRYSYIPLIGIFILMVWGVADFAHKWDRKAVVCSAVATAILVVCAGATWRQVSYWRDTKTLFSHALSVNSNNFMAYFCLGLDSDKSGRTAEAIEYYKKSIAIAPWYSEPYLQIGYSLQKEGKNEEALLMFDKAITLEPDSFAAQTGRATFLSNINRMAEAVEGYERAIAINPESADAYSNLALAMQKLKRLDEAVDLYYRALRINPHSAMAHANLGGVLVSQGKHDEAIDHYTAVLTADPQSFSAHHNLGVIYQKLHRGDEAIDHYRKALQLNASLPETHNNLGVALAEQGMTDAAIEQFKLAIKFRPDYDEARRNLDFALAGGAR